MSAEDMLALAIQRIDEANGADPNQEEADGRVWPKELLYSHRMSDMLERFRPDADDVAKIAVRAQHIERWKSARSDFAEGRQGYLQWRTQLYRFHAETVGAILRDVGYDEAFVERVMKAVGKKALKVNADTQLLEDVVDLTFIEHYMLAFAGKHPEYDEDKWIDIVRKTWKKMSPEAQRFALGATSGCPSPWFR